MIKNIIQAYEGELLIENQACINSIKVAMPVGVGYFFVSPFPAELDRSKGLRNASDIFRFEWFLKNPFDLWLDCDVKMGERGWPDFKDNGKPYFANIWGKPDTWAIYPNGQVELIKKVYEQATKSKSPNLLGTIICIFVDRVRSEINLIPNGHFIHTSKR